MCLWRLALWSENFPPSPIPLPPSCLGRGERGILADSSANLPTRQRAERLHDQLAAALGAEQVEVVRSQAEQKTVQEWAAGYIASQSN